MFLHSINFTKQCFESTQLYRPFILLYWSNFTTKATGKQYLDFKEVPSFHLINVEMSLLHKKYPNWNLLTMISFKNWIETINSKMIQIKSKVILTLLSRFYCPVYWTCNQMVFHLPKKYFYVNNYFPQLCKMRCFVGKLDLYASIFLTNYLYFG